MNRRPAGALVMVAALIAVVVLASVNRPGIAGSAVALPPPPAPSMGDCLLNEPNAFVVLSTDQLITDSADLGQCSGPKFGEVFGVIHDVKSDSAAPQVCIGLLDGYLDQPAVLPDGWSPILLPRMLYAVPSIRQEWAGQDWIACVITPQPVALNQPYDGTIAGAMGAGAIPTRYATCSSTPPAAVPDRDDCAEPHSAENFGFRIIDGPGPAPADLQTGCQAMVERQTGMPDLATHLDLRVRVLVYLYLETPTLTTEAVPEANYAQAYCQLASVDDRQLAASLIGLGSDPIPWA